MTEYLKCANPACQKELRHDIKLKRPFNKPSIAHCCNKCAQLDPTTKSTIEQTCLEKYGCVHPSQSKQSREKMKETLAHKPQSHWDNSAKRRKSTCLERYGVSHVMQVKEIAKKCAEKFKSRPEDIKKAQFAKSVQKKIALYGDGSNGKKVSETKKLFQLKRKLKSAENAKRRLKKNTAQHACSTLKQQSASHL